jgi:hypothetical protein
VYDRRTIESLRVLKPSIVHIVESITYAESTSSLKSTPTGFRDESFSSRYAIAFLSSDSTDQVISGRETELMDEMQEFDVARFKFESVLRHGCERSAVRAKI